jgi:hypothetical protein
MICPLQNILNTPPIRRIVTHNIPRVMGRPHISHNTTATQGSSVNSGCLNENISINVSKAEPAVMLNALEFSTSKKLPAEGLDIDIDQAPASHAALSDE